MPKPKSGKRSASQAGPKDEANFGVTPGGSGSKSQKLAAVAKAPTSTLAGGRPVAAAASSSAGSSDKKTKVVTGVAVTTQIKNNTAVTDVAVTAQAKNDIAVTDVAVTAQDEHGAAGADAAVPDAAGGHDRVVWADIDSDFDGSIPTKIQKLGTKSFERTFGIGMRGSSKFLIDKKQPTDYYDQSLRPWAERIIATGRKCIKQKHNTISANERKEFEELSVREVAFVESASYSSEKLERFSSYVVEELRSFSATDAESRAATSRSETAKAKKELLNTQNELSAQRKLNVQHEKQLKDALVERDVARLDISKERAKSAQYDDLALKVGVLHQQRQSDLKKLAAEDVRFQELSSEHLDQADMLREALAKKTANKKALRALVTEKELLRQQKQSVEKELRLSKKMLKNAKRSSKIRETELLRQVYRDDESPSQRADDEELDGDRSGSDEPAKRAEKYPNRAPDPRRRAPATSSEEEEEEENESSDGEGQESLSDNALPGEDDSVWSKGGTPVLRRSPSRRAASRRPRSRSPRGDDRRRRQRNKSRSVSRRRSLSSEDDRNERHRSSKDSRGSRDRSKSPQNPRDSRERSVSPEPKRRVKKGPPKASVSEADQLSSSEDEGELKKNASGHNSYIFHSDRIHLDENGSTAFLKEGEDLRARRTDYSGFSYNIIDKDGGWTEGNHLGAPTVMGGPKPLPIPLQTALSRLCPAQIVEVYDYDPARKPDLGEYLICAVVRQRVIEFIAGGSAPLADGFIDDMEECDWAKLTAFFRDRGLANLVLNIISVIVSEVNEMGFQKANSRYSVLIPPTACIAIKDVRQIYSSAENNEAKRHHIDWRNSGGIVNVNNSVETSIPIEAATALGGGAASSTWSGVEGWGGDGGELPSSATTYDEGELCCAGHDEVSNLTSEPPSAKKQKIPTLGSDGVETLDSFGPVFFGTQGEAERLLDRLQCQIQGKQYLDNVFFSTVTVRAANTAVASAFGDLSSPEAQRAAKFFLAAGYDTFAGIIDALQDMACQEKNKNKALPQRLDALAESIMTSGAGKFAMNQLISNANIKSNLKLRLTRIMGNAERTAGLESGLSPFAVKLWRRSEVEGLKSRISADVVQYHEDARWPTFGGKHARSGKWKSPLFKSTLEGLDPVTLLSQFLTLLLPNELIASEQEADKVLGKLCAGNAIDMIRKLSNFDTVYYLLPILALLLIRGEPLISKINNHADMTLPDSVMRTHLVDIGAAKQLLVKHLEGFFRERFHTIMPLPKGEEKSSSSSYVEEDSRRRGKGDKGKGKKGDKGKGKNGDRGGPREPRNPKPKKVGKPFAGLSEGVKRELDNNGSPAVFGIFPCQKEQDGSYRMTGATSEALDAFANKWGKKVDRSGKGVVPRNTCYQFHLHESCQTPAERHFGQTSTGGRFQLSYKSHKGLAHGAPAKVVRKTKPQEQKENLARWSEILDSNEENPLRFTCKGFDDVLPEWVKGAKV